VRSPLFSERQDVWTSERPGTDLGGYVLALAVATGIFLVALDHATYGVVSRTTLAVGVWWAVVLVAALGLRPTTRLPAPAYVAGGFLLALSAWTLASTQWSVSAGDAFDEFGRTALYLGLFALVLLVSTRGSGGRWADGVAIGITAVALLALTSRLFPDVISTNDYRTVLTSAYARLSYPLGYWNGLAILTGMAFPLLFRAAIESRYAALRGLALTPIPALAAVLYLTSSRGGFAVAFFGTVCFLLLTTRRWSAIAAAVLAGAASIGAVAVLQARSELVNHPGLPVAESQGHHAAALIAALCVLTGIVWTAGTILLQGRLPASVTLERAAVVLVVVVTVVGIAVSRPVHRFHEFKALPNTAKTGNLVTNHLTSTSGSGRWQLWTAALDEFRAHPLKGGGAGSFGAWWLRSPHFEGFALDAHNLYAETLGELGIIGFLLLAGLLLTGAVSGLVRAVGGIDAAPALLASFLAFALGAAVDWMWELTAVTIVAVVLLAVLTGPATKRVRRYAARDEPSRRIAIALGAAVALIGIFVIGAEGVGLASQLKIQQSQSATARGDLVAAANDAADARSIQPWSSTPYLQLALVGEQAGQLRQAERWIGKAIDRDRDDWQLWVTQARIQTKLGEAAAAVNSLNECRRLYPSSQLCS
jgi:O-Antigen ligase